MSVHLTYTVVFASVLAEELCGENPPGSGFYATKGTPSLITLRGVVGRSTMRDGSIGGLRPRRCCGMSAACPLGTSSDQEGLQLRLGALDGLTSRPTRGEVRPPLPVFVTTQLSP